MTLVFAGGRSVRRSNMAREPASQEHNLIRRKPLRLSVEPARKLLGLQHPYTLIDFAVVHDSVRWEHNDSYRLDFESRECRQQAAQSVHIALYLNNWITVGLKAIHPYTSVGDVHHGLAPAGKGASLCFNDEDATRADKDVIGSASLKRNAMQYTRIRVKSDIQIFRDSAFPFSAELQTRGLTPLLPPMNRNDDGRSEKPPGIYPRIAGRVF